MLRNMEKRRNILITIAIALSAALILIRSCSEPTYEQVSLTDWLEIYVTTAQLEEGAINWRLGSGKAPQSEPLRAKEAGNAIRQMGPQALPYLIKWMKARSSPPPNHEADPRLYRAFVGFVALGTNAAAAIPDLAKIASDSTGPGVPFAIMALIEIGPAAIPALTNTLISPVKLVYKEHLLRDLKGVFPGKSAAIPILTAALKHPDGKITRDAAELLGKLGEQPNIIIPHLIGALNRPEYYVRITAAEALACYGQQARPAVPKLLGALKYEDKRSQEYYLQALRKIAPEALPNTDANQ